jgi:hypothetical protein
MNIRTYTPEDYSMIKSWHCDAPDAEQFPATSFILEKNNIPTVCISVILTNTPICYMDNMVGNPEIKDRKDATQTLMNYAWNFAKDKGYKYSVAITKHKKLADRHIQMGWQELSNGIILGRVI